MPLDGLRPMLGISGVEGVGFQERSWPHHEDGAVRTLQHLAADRAEHCLGSCQASGPDDHERGVFGLLNQRLNR